MSLGLVHTDDRLALLEIVKQLDVKEDFGDKITVRYHLSDDKYVCLLKNVTSMRLSYMQLSFSGLLEYLLQALREGINLKQECMNNCST